MFNNEKRLKILLFLLLILIIVTAVVMAQGSKKPQVVYVNQGPEYDPDILMLGVRISKFGGMPIYMDNPGVLLSQSDKLGLTQQQQQRLEEIIQQARHQAISVLTPEQIAQMDPVREEPFVVDKLDRTIVSCESCSGQTCAISAPDHVH